MRLAWILVAFAGAACGRVGFGARTDGGAVRACPAVCGPSGSESCCGSPLVPGGTFFRTYDGVGLMNMSFPATVSTFALDKYEVTVGRFRQFVDEGFGTQLQPPAADAGARTLAGAADQAGWDPAWNADLPVDDAAGSAARHCSAGFEPWTDAAGDNEGRPINCVSWYEAMAFCVWDDGFLPTEAEWNYAASGGAEQRVYPWSNPPADATIDGAHASYDTGASNCTGDDLPGCTVADLAVVGSKPAGDGAWGHSDLAGNVFEWVLDAFITPYPTATCADCASLAGTQRVWRGGAFDKSAASLRAGLRDQAGPTNRNDSTGFRCARSP